MYVTSPFHFYNGIIVICHQFSSSCRQIRLAGGDNVGRSGDDDDSDARYHLFRPIAALCNRVAAELKPMRELENALDQIIDHLDDLDAKSDAKLEELMLKKNNYLEATRKMQSAFK